MSKSLLLVVAAVVLAGLGLYFQAANAHYSHTQANAIVKADQASPAANVNSTPGLADLQTFVHTHMGSSVSFTLTGSYNQALKASQAAAAAQSSNANVYAAAQAACSGKTDSITQAKCNQQYLQTHLQSQSSTPVAAPKQSDYQFRLKSPFWTPDLAGSLLLGAALAVVFVFFTSFSRRNRRLA